MLDSRPQIQRVNYLPCAVRCSWPRTDSKRLRLTLFHTLPHEMGEGREASVSPSRRGTQGRHPRAAIGCEGSAAVFRRRQKLWSQHGDPPASTPRPSGADSCSRSAQPPVPSEERSHCELAAVHFSEVSSLSPLGPERFALIQERHGTWRMLLGVGHRQTLSYFCATGSTQAIAELPLGRLPGGAPG